MDNANNDPSTHQGIGIFSAAEKRNYITRTQYHPYMVHSERKRRHHQSPRRSKGSGMHFARSVAGMATSGPICVLKKGLVPVICGISVSSIFNPHKNIPPRWTGDFDASDIRDTRSRFQNSLPPGPHGISTARTPAYHLSS